VHGLPARPVDAVGQCGHAPGTLEADQTADRWSPMAARRGLLWRGRGRPIQQFDADFNGPKSAAQRAAAGATVDACNASASTPRQCGGNLESAGIKKSVKLFIHLYSHKQETNL
jgi:hypothetical protein